MPHKIFEILRRTISSQQKIVLIYDLMKTESHCLDEKHGTSLESVLHEACFNGDRELLAWLLNQNLELLNAETQEGTNVLCYAAKYENKIAIDFLLSLDKGSDLSTAMNKEGLNSLYFAALGGNVEILLSLHASRNAYFVSKLKLPETKIEDSFFDTNKIDLMFEIVKNGYLKMLKFAMDLYKLKNGKTFEQTNDGLYLIHYAAQKGYTDIVKYLLDEHKADINLETKDAWGNTPLQVAAAFGHLPLVKELIKRGAEFKKPNKRGYYPIHRAAAYGHTPVVEYFLDKHKIDMDLETKDDWENTPLQEAAAFGHLPLVKELIKRGAEFTKPNKKGWYPIHRAAWNGHIDVIRYFVLARGVDINLKQGTQTIREIAIEGGHPEIIDELLELQTPQPCFTESFDRSTIESKENEDEIEQDLRTTIKAQNEEILKMKGKLFDWGSKGGIDVREFLVKSYSCTEKKEDEEKIQQTLNEIIETQAEEIHRLGELIARLISAPKTKSVALQNQMNELTQADTAKFFKRRASYNSVESHAIQAKQLQKNVRRYSCNF